MAASSFALACDALVRERDRVFLERVAKDYNLDIEELSAKYLECADAAIKVPRKYTKKPKSVVVETVDGDIQPKSPETRQPVVKAEKQCCTSQTSKKEPCKFTALKGEVFCKRHLRVANGDPAPVKEPKAKKASKPEEPVHTHPLDQKPAEPCVTCEKFGAPLEAVPTKFEVVGTAAQRLAAMLAEESESESDGEGEIDFVEEEAYEDE